VNRVAAFFDVEGTLYADNTWRALARHHWNRRTRRLRVAWYLALHLTDWAVLYRTGLRPREPVVRGWAEHLPWLVAGWPVRRVEAAFQWMLDRHLMPSVHPETLSALRAHADGGHHTVLVSGAPEPLLAMVARRVGAERVLGTRWEVAGGAYTGKVIPPACMGQEKARRIEELLTGELSGIDLSASYAYGDTMADVPLLESVGHPVATFPDPELAAHARQRGWEMLGGGA